MTQLLKFNVLRCSMSSHYVKSTRIMMQISHDDDYDH